MSTKLQNLAKMVIELDAQGADGGIVLNDWEINFIESMMKELNEKDEFEWLSEKQMDKIDDLWRKYTK